MSDFMWHLPTWCGIVCEAMPCVQCQLARRTAILRHTTLSLHGAHCSSLLLRARTCVGHRNIYHGLSNMNTMMIKNTTTKSMRIPCRSLAKQRGQRSADECKNIWKFEMQSNAIVATTACKGQSRTRCITFASANCFGSWEWARILLRNIKSH